MKLRRGSCQHMSFRTNREWTSRPIRHAASGALHDRNQRHVVVRLESGLENDVAVSRREQTVDVTISTKTAQSSGFRNPLERLCVCAREHIGRRRVEARIRNALARAGARQSTAEQRQTRLPCPPLPCEGNVDQAAERLLLIGQRDQRTEERKAGDEALGAVDGIDDPGEGAARLAPDLLTDDTMFRKTLLDPLPETQLPTVRSAIVTGLSSDLETTSSGVRK
ncbi:hypothetical protein ACVWY2_000145 [Bradyrhizobium sp. JR6.1]